MITRILIALAVLAGLVFGEQAYEHHLIGLGVTREAARRDALDAKALKDATAAALVKERAFNAARAQDETKRLLEKTGYETQIADLIRRANAGDIGMRVRVRPVCGPAAPASAGVVVGPGDAQDASLMPGTVAAILDIAGRDAQNVRDYNALLDEYNKLVVFVNTGP